jgi:transposase InsO family protein
MPPTRSNNSNVDADLQKEMDRILLLERAKEKLKKYKLSCTRLEAKKGLEPLVTKDGLPVQNAIIYNQWEKQLVNWMKTVNVYWAVDPNTTEEKKNKHAKAHAKALETLYICLESAVQDPVAKAEVQDEGNQEDGAKALKALKDYFKKEKDEVNLESVEEEFRDCKPAKGETIEAWLLRIRQFEVLLANTERKKTDSEVLCIIKKNLPREFAEFKLKYAMKEGVKRESYVKALKKWAQYLQYPKKGMVDLTDDTALVTAATSMTTVENKCSHCGKKGHSIANCWKANPQLKPDWLKKKEEKQKAKQDGGLLQGHQKQSSGNNPGIANVAASDDQSKWNICLCADGGDVKMQDQLETSWLIDSCCSKHICPTLEEFSNYIPLREKSYIGGVSGEPLEAVGVGKVTIPFTDIDGMEGSVTLSNVLHVPSAKYHLISVSQMVKKGATTVFTKDPLLIFPGGAQVRIEPYNDLYKLPKVKPVALMVREESLTTWHARLGHRSKQTLQKMADQKIVNGLSINKHPSSADTGPCDTCQRANMKKAPVPKLTQKRAEAPNMRVFTDTSGIIKGEDGKALKMFGGTTVFQFYVDDAARRIIGYDMKGKTEQEYLSTLKQYITSVGQPMAILRSDGAPEFETPQCRAFYEEHRIKREITPADTPQYNGVAERAIQTIFRMARAIRLEAKLPIHLAPFAVKYAIEIYNCLGHKALQGRTPEEAWSGQTPDVGKFRTFGCKVWVMSTDKHLPKFANRSRVGVFLGFPKSHKGYLCYFPDTNRVVVTHQPVFDEMSFPFAAKELQERFSSEGDRVELMDDDDHRDQHPLLHDFDVEMLNEIRRSDCLPQQPCADTCSPSEQWEDDRPEAGDDIAPEDYRDITSNSGPGSTRYGRVTRPPQQFWIPSSSAVAISLSAVESVIKANQIFEPETYTEAMQCADAEEWKDSIQTEVNTLLANNTFTVVDRNTVPEGRRIVKSKWVFKVKKDSQGNFLSRKTRLVAKGFTQIPGVDYFEVFHPVGKGVTFRLLCAKAACSNLQLYHVDIKGAFLHAELEEEIYMELPPGTGFENGCENAVVKLLKTLYGLKQAGCGWHRIHTAALLELGFVMSMIDPCLFYHPEKDIWVHVYVDDDLVGVKDKNDFDWLVKRLSQHFTVGSATVAEHYLGIRIQQQEGCIKLDQQAAVEDLLSKYGLEEAKPVATPAVPNSKLMPLQEGQEITKAPYRSLVGALLYLSMHTRPDISYAVNELARHCSKPSEQHWVAAKRVLRYLAGTKHQGLVFEGRLGMNLVAAADSDWAGGWKNTDEGTRSTSGYVVTIAGGVIACKTKRQTSTALSSCEAEYMSLALAAQEIVHCRQLLSDLQECQKQPTVLYCDNLAAGELAKSETHQQRSKHIAIRYHFIRECIRRQEIEVKWISGQDNYADMFTKALGRILFEKHSKTILGSV